MKNVLVRILIAIGLVPARRYTVLSQRIETLNHEARAWKKRAHKAHAQAAALEKQLEQQSRKSKDARAAADRQDGELAKMQTRLLESERALTVAREQLMAIEVKLDILEGAANVLDARTRVAPQRQPGASGAPV